MPRFTTLKSMESAVGGSFLRFEVVRPTPCDFSYYECDTHWSEKIKPVIGGLKSSSYIALDNIIGAAGLSTYADKHYGEFMDKDFGASALIPLQTQYEYLDKQPSKYKDFMDRKAHGEIVLNDMHRVTQVATCRPGVPSSEVSLYGTRDLIHQHPQVYGAWPKNASGCPMRPVVREYGDYHLGANYPSDEAGTRFTFNVWSTLSSLVYPMNVNGLGELKGVIRGSLAELEVDTGLVTATRAESNEKLLDLSTTLAEAPETIKSIMDACKIALIKYLECRKRIKVLKRNIIGKDQKLVDLAAQEWLRYRYEVMPNILTVQSALEYLDSEVIQYMTTRNGSHVDWVPPSYEGWSCAPSSVFNRVFIKNRFDMQMSKARQGLGHNLALTWWETVPLSFIVDWFLNIGELLASFGAPSGSVQEGCMYSFRCQSELVYTNPLWVGPPITVSTNFYKAFKINPDAHLGFNIQLDLNWKRKLDSAALLWSMFKGEFQQSLRKLR